MVLEEIKNRRNIRSYLDKEIPEEVLHKVLETDIIIIQSKKGKLKCLINYLF